MKKNQIENDLKDILALTQGITFVQSDPDFDEIFSFDADYTSFNILKNLAMMQG